uniref:RNA (guanine-9-)-methyltransferase domain-containing protein 1 n=1 Tax=Glossina brevipalpis TaxID=37001 RepID=A0A1A9WYV7_9MUSC
MFNRLNVFKKAGCIVLAPRKTLDFKRLLQSKSSQLIAEAACTKPVNSSEAGRFNNEKDGAFGASNIDKKSTTLAMSPEEKERRLKVLKLEVEVARQEGLRVPSLHSIKNHEWDQIIAIPSKSARMKYYAFLWKIAVTKENKQKKKEENAPFVQERIEKIRQERAENPHIVYGLGHVSMFLRIYDTTINHWMNHRLIRAMLYSPKIVLDCSYDNHMTKRESENAAKQLMLCFAENRAHDDPFDLHYCNVDMESTCMKKLRSYIPTMLNPEFPMNHCHNDLQTYNEDDVYIIGAMVDKSCNQPLSLAKAKRLGLRVARLPFDRYLQWGAGSGKSLALNQMVSILLDLRKTGDWNIALQHVPKRKMEESKEETAYLYEKQKNRVNIRIDKIFKPMNSVRSHKKDLEFNLSTWGSKK